VARGGHDFVADRARFDELGVVKACVQGCACPFFRCSAPVRCLNSKGWTRGMSLQWVAELLVLQGAKMVCKGLMAT
jgi:hypothetical protein